MSGPCLAAIRGFTLLEILIALSTFFVILFAVYTSFESSRATFAAGEQKADIQQNARIAMELMSMDLRLIGYGYPNVPSTFDRAVNNCAAEIGIPTSISTPPTSTSITYWADIVNASTILAADVAAGNTILSVNDASGFTAGDTLYLINGAQSDRLTVQAVNTGVVPHTITLTAGTCNAYPWGSQVSLPRQVSYSWAAGPPPNPGTIFKDDGIAGGPQPLAGTIQNFQLQYFDAGDNPTAIPANIRRIAITVTVQSPQGWWRQQAFNIVSDIRPRNL